MARLLRPRLKAAKVFTIRHWPKMMLVVINLPMLSFWCNLSSFGGELFTQWQDMKAMIAADANAVNDQFIQNFIPLTGKLIGAIISFTILMGSDLVLDIYVLATNSVRAAKLRRAIFWAFNSIFLTADIAVRLSGFSAVEISWWFTRLSNMDMMDGKSPEELLLAQQAFATQMTATLAEEAKTLAMTAAGASWFEFLRQWAWDTWKDSWVQPVVIGWVLHVLIMDLQGQPRTWWGGRLQRDHRDEETVPDTPDEKKPSDSKMN